MNSNNSKNQIQVGGSSEAGRQRSRVGSSEARSGQVVRGAGQGRVMAGRGGEGASGSMAGRERSGGGSVISKHVIMPRLCCLNEAGNQWRRPAVPTPRSHAQAQAWPSIGGSTFDAPIFHPQLKTTIFFFIFFTFLLIVFQCVSYLCLSILFHLLKVKEKQPIQKQVIFPVSPVSMLLEANHASWTYVSHYNSAFLASQQRFQLCTCTTLWTWGSIRYY